MCPVLEDHKEFKSSSYKPVYLSSMTYIILINEHEPGTGKILQKKRVLHPFNMSVFDYLPKKTPKSL